MKKLKATASILFMLLSVVVQVSAYPPKGAKPVTDPTVVINDFQSHLQKIPYLSDAGMTTLNHEIDEHIKCLKNWSDKEEYAKEHDLYHYLKEQRDSVSTYHDYSETIVSDFLRSYQFADAEKETTCRDSLKAVLSDRLGKIETSLNFLDREMNGGNEKSFFDGLDWKTIAVCVIILLLIGVLYLLFKKKSQPATPVPAAPANRVASSQGNNGDAGIIVRRKTATILKKQSLEDVIGNPNYLQIDAADFTYESAVRRIYIKNTCIIDIYEMYAEDLSRPDNPKEDGCMVLGRWVYDNESQEYYVSLEQIVLPGDDAVFAEYELNFGGKIKLRVLEQLRKLRRETNFQYDLTCWIHSHPGLGVFFSVSDVSVQTQLKHPSHPNFLTAIVVDILTPKQDLGIFTYRRDTTINSKNDLKKLYSLQEWYEWAVNSMNGNTDNTDKGNEEVKEFSREDFFDTLADATERKKECQAIGLSREAIIDMCMAISEQYSGLVALVHGHENALEEKKEYTATVLSNSEQADKADLIGCFVVDNHLSIPSIRKAVDNYLDRIKFVLFYSPAEGILTTIPVEGNELSTNENNYGEQKLEDLKLWTRRKA